ncbi:hypothetical protein HN51_021758 [Arachis hypogaea]
MKRSPIQMYDRLLNMAGSALTEICNAVAVASLLNATLVMPKFLYSNDDIRIVKELPPHMKSQDLNAVGSQMQIFQEATSADYIKIVLPILLKNGFVHFLGYGNRLGFDPLPFDI